MPRSGHFGRVVGMKRTIILTGASDGIGAAAAKRLATDDNTLILVGRNSEKTRAVAAPLG